MEKREAENLKALAGIRHAFFTRDGGVSAGVYATLNGGLSSDDDPAAVVENRRRAAAELGVPVERFLSCYQNHSPDVVTVVEPWKPEERPRADALVTRERDMALVILTADCVPVLLADPDSGVIGAAHAGWRGALTGVLPNTIEAMEKLGARRERIHAALGPCISQLSYEVGPEFPAPFMAESEAHQRFFRPLPHGGRYMFDLPGYVMAKLRALDVASVEPPPADTCADAARFFSYRRAGATGRLMSGIMRFEVRG